MSTRTDSKAPLASDRILRWDVAARRWRDGVPNGDVLVADSWLVEDGLVRGMECHWRRFATACRSFGAHPAQLEAVLEATTAVLPTAGRWFPRLDWRSDGIGLQVRRAPSRLPTAVCWVADTPDDRRAPRRKGPDLERLAEWRAHAALAGADEALLVDARGRLLEGAFTSLIWWDRDAIVFVPDEAPILDGVTRLLVRRLARALGVQVRYELVTPDALGGREVWVASALHGIRQVVEIRPGVLTAPASRADRWSRMLDSLSRPLLPRVGVSAGAINGARQRG